MKDQSTETGDPGIWQGISGTEELDAIAAQSVERPQVIYKHSTRCSISFLALQELKDAAVQIAESADLYQMNVIEQRNLSNDVASRWNIRHESPQVIILKDGEVFWSGSHWDVNGLNVLEALKAA